MITLRPYQQQGITEIQKAMRTGHRHIIYQLPTGGGKTVVFSYIVSEMKKTKKRALIITDRTELLNETGGTLSEFGLTPFLITAGQVAPPPSYYQVYVAMAQTLRNRINPTRYKDDWAKWFKSFDLVIIDECHKQEFNPFFSDDVDSRSNCSANVFNGAYILGFTATPERRGKQRQLAADYTTIVSGPTTLELISLGYLVEDRYYSVKGADIDGVRLDTKEEDFNTCEIYRRFNKPELYAGVVEQWMTHTPNTTTLVFCVNIQHTIRTCEEFNNARIKAKFVVSDVAKPTLPDNATAAQLVRYEEKMAEYQIWLDAFSKWSGKRGDIVEQWKRGDFFVLINAGILTTGFNFRPIQTVVINRATISANLWLQMIGRGSRPSDGKDFFNILDFGQHAVRLGYYRDKRQLSLIHETPKGGGAPAVKECGKTKRHGVKPDALGRTIDKNKRIGCGAYIPASVMICPFCGYLYDTERELATTELQLHDYSIAPNSGAVIASSKMNDDIQNIVSTAEARGYKSGWIHAQIAFKLGYAGLSAYAEIQKYSTGWAWRMKKQFRVD